jgi:trehalose synthase
MNSIGIKTGWRVIQGAPDFFNITKKMHNALQGEGMRLTQRKQKIYEEVIHENSIRNHLEEDNVVIVHDPQPLPLVLHYQRKAPWIWCCHVDLSRPDPNVWGYLKQFVEQYDAAIFSAQDYRQTLRIPQYFFLPAIDPFTIKNRELSGAEIDERLKRYKIPTDVPLVVQISRFDRWKDPEGVIRAFRLARRHVECRLVLLGNMALDDPEAQKVYQSVLRHRGEDIVIQMSGDDSALINALQRRAAVVLQKSIREGFGLTVTEAMWKGTPVIGSKVGGIRHQIEDGRNGFLVSSVEETADRLLLLLKNPKLRKRMGEAARDTVKRRFLLPRYLEQYLDLFDSFETVVRLRRPRD